MKLFVRRLTGSIVAQVTALTFGALVLWFVLVIAIAQTPLIGWIFPKALSDNARSIGELVWLVESFPEESEYFILSAYRGSSRTAWVSEGFPPGARANPAIRAHLKDLSTDATARLADRDIRFKQLKLWELRRQAGLSDETTTAAVSTTPREDLTTVRAAAALQIAIQLRDGRVLNVRLAPSVHLAERPVVFAAIVVFALVFAVVFSMALASVTLRPIRSLERDAERVGLAEIGSGVSETGPAELRRLTQAFNRMRARLASLIQEREQMVAAIAHDIRTGLTRVRLRIDAKGSVSPDDLESDLSQMEALITDMLAYARAESPSGPRELINLASFVDDVLNAAPTPIDYTPRCEGAGGDFVIAGDPVGLRRLLDNLMENARRYGGGDVGVVVVQDAAGLELRVEDNGPGLPEAMLEAVFEPFLRAEGSRSRDSGGSGLGLSIARAIARAHGASLHLENRPQGGLAAVIRFPSAVKT